MTDQPEPINRPLTDADQLKHYTGDIEEPTDTLTMPWPWRCINCYRASDTLDNDNICARCASEEKP